MLYRAILSFTIIWASVVESLLLPGNKTVSHHYNLPEIHEGEKCEVGKTYRMACNACYCSKKSLVCTKMACVDWKPPKHVNSSSNLKISLRNARPKSSKYPDLPKGLCEPGKIYMAGSSTCFCESNQKSVCSKKRNLNKEETLYETLEATHPLFNSPEKTLPSLPSQATKCEPGNKYNVDCNACLCLHNNNLVCTKMLCLSYDDMNRVEARKQTDVPCHNLDKVNKECIKCICVKNKRVCEPVYGCVSTNLKQKLSHHGKPPKQTLNYNKHNCTEFSIYRDDCNLCFCRKSTLRCTQKTCLKYRQVLQFKKQRLFLELNGL